MHSVYFCILCLFSYIQHPRFTSNCRIWTWSLNHFDQVTSGTGQNRLRVNSMEVFTVGDSVKSNENLLTKWRRFVRSRSIVEKGHGGRAFNWVRTELQRAISFQCTWKTTFYPSERIKMKETVTRFDCFRWFNSFPYFSESDSQYSCLGQNLHRESDSLKYGKGLIRMIR